MAVEGKKPSKLPWWCWAILFGLFIGWAMGNSNDDPCGDGCKRIPPSTPTDVGTLTPGP